MLPPTHFVPTILSCSVQMGRKKNRNALSSNAQGVRRGAVNAEDRAPKARGVSRQLGVCESAVSSPVGPGGARPPSDIWCIFSLSFNAAGSLESAVSSPAGRADEIWCIFGLKMLYLARPSRAIIVNAYLLKTANRLCQVIFVSEWFINFLFQIFRNELQTDSK